VNVAIIGGGPGGLYAAILLKKADPRSTVRVYERNRPDDTFGFGVVFSDATMDNLKDADESSWHSIISRFHHWEDIDIHYRGRVLTSTGHGFAGLSRLGLLQILAARAAEVGVELAYESEVTIDSVAGADLVIASDGVNSAIRDSHPEWFEPTIDSRPNRFVWLGTTRPFPAFTFYFKHDAHGLWRGHAYQYEDGHSTFIVETTEAAFAASGLDPLDESATVAYCEALFAEEMDGHRLLANRSVWRQFPTVTNAHWHHENVVLLGDAAHTAHFSVGSGTKLALEDSIALAESLAGAEDVPSALVAYEADRRDAVLSLQRAAQASLEWFEETERYQDLAPIQFGFSLLTRSLRITHEDLRERDPDYVRRVDTWFADAAEEQADEQIPRTDGVVGGAGLVMTEMTDVTRNGRITTGCTGLYRDEHVGAWKRIVDFVHGNTDAKIGVQLAHAGRKGATRLPWEGMDEPLDEGGWEIIAPSAIPWFDHSQVPREMTRHDMDEVRDGFVAASERALLADFDLLELHFAHGYLLGSFISPLTNRRIDEYGGELANRLRYPLEVFHAVREVWPDERPISVRVSATDWKPGGVTAADAVDIAHVLKEAGVDIVDVSAGQTVPDQRPRYGRLFQTPFAERIRHEVGVPTMAVGAVSSYSDVNTILAAGRADLCCIARMHLWDPYWTRHAAHELGHALPWPPPYAVLDRYTPRFK
jgi:anthraniloyl-CoA monooxygenase